MSKTLIWAAVVMLVPSVAGAQAIAANSAVPVTAGMGAVGAPVVADGLMPRAAGADQIGDRPISTGMLGLDDVKLVYAPQPSQYQPEGNGDAGPPVRVACLIGTNGGMQNCSVAGNGAHDPAVVELALGDVSQFVVAPRTHDGRPVAGQTLVVTCQFQPVDGGRQDLAAN